MFFEIEECFFPILFTINVRVGGETNMRMIQDEPMNDSLANFQSFRLKIDLGNRRANVTRSYFEICARNNVGIMSTVFICEIPFPSRRPIFLLLLLLDTVFILCIRFGQTGTQHDTRYTTHDHKTNTITTTNNRTHFFVHSEERNAQLALVRLNSNGRRSRICRRF